MLAHVNFGSAPKIKKRRKRRRKIGERIGNKGKVAPKNRKRESRRKAVTKSTNCCRAVGKWTSVDLENSWIKDHPRLSQGESGQT